MSTPEQDLNQEQFIEPYIDGELKHSVIPGIQEMQVGYFEKENRQSLNDLMNTLESIRPKDSTYLFAKIGRGRNRALICTIPDVSFFDVTYLIITTRGFSEISFTDLSGIVETKKNKILNPDAPPIVKDSTYHSSLTVMDTLIKNAAQTNGKIKNLKMSFNKSVNGPLPVFTYIRTVLFPLNLIASSVTSEALDFPVDHKISSLNDQRGRQRAYAKIRSMYDRYNTLRHNDTAVATLADETSRELSTFEAEKKRKNDSKLF